MLSAALLTLCHEQGALLVNAMSFGTSALLNSMLRTAPHAEVPAAGRTSPRQFVSDFVEGLRFIGGSSEVRYLLLMSSLVNFFLAGYNLMTPFVQMSFGAGDAAYAEPLTSSSVGGVLGAPSSPAFLATGLVALGSRSSLRYSDAASALPCCPRSFTCGRHLLPCLPAYLCLLSCSPSTTSSSSASCRPVSMKRTWEGRSAAFS